MHAHYLYLMITKQTIGYVGTNGYPWGKMSTTISRLNSSLEECFFSQSPDNGSHIKTGLQGCKYLRNSCTHFTAGVSILPPQTLIHSVRFSEV